jgi:hypothetical protein
VTTSSDSMTMLAHVSNQWLANVSVVGHSRSPLPRGPPAGRCEYNVLESRSNYIYRERVRDSQARLGVLR